MVIEMSSPGENIITYDDFVDMQNRTDDTLELIDGIVYMSPSPSIKHQEISSYLHGELYIYLKGKNARSFLPQQMLYCKVITTMIRKKSFRIYLSPVIPMDLTKTNM